MPIEYIWHEDWEPPVWRFAFNTLNWICLQLDALDDRIAGVPFVGEALALPVRWLASLCWDLLGGFSDVSRSWGNTWRFIHGLVDGDIFNILASKWGLGQDALIGLITSWIVYYAQQYLEYWVRVFVDLKTLIYDAVASVAPWFPSFVESPFDWFMGMLTENFGPLYWFSIDPVGYITGEIYRLFPVTKYIFDDPVDWLRYRLSDLFGVDIDFWDDPLESIKASIQLKLIDMIEGAKDELYEVGEHLFRYFLEGVW